MVASAKLLTYRRKRDAEILTQNVHEDLSWPDNLFSSGFIVYTIFVDIIEIGNNFDNILDLDGFLGFGAVLENVFDLIHAKFPITELGLASNNVDNSFNFPDVVLDRIGNNLNNLSGEGYAMNGAFGLDYGHS